MRRILIVAGVVVAVLVLFAGAVWIKMHASDPEVLVANLRRAEGEEAEDALRAINLARGDVVTPLTKAFQDETASGEFRLKVLDVLFKRYHREPDPELEEVLKQARTDPLPEIRRRAVYNWILFGESEHQVELLDRLDDEDLVVREHIYRMLNDRRRGRWLWRRISEEQHAAVLEDAQRDMDAQNETVAFLARGVIGREVADRADDASQALQSGDPVQAEELLTEALTLDPDSHYARIRRVRYLLATGRREQALEAADEYGALVRVPRLSTAPIADGDPTDAVWDEAWTTEKTYKNTSQWVAQPADGRSRIAIGHRDNTVYIAVWGYEKDLSKLSIKHMQPDGPVHRDDCVEIVFDPDNTERNVYKFNINAAGVLADRYDRGRRGQDEDFLCEHVAKMFPDRGYWALEFALPVSELHDRTLTSESLWGILVLRTRIGPASESGSIWPTYGNNLNYHLYPLAVFEDAPAPEPPAEAEPADEAETQPAPAAEE